MVYIINIWGDFNLWGKFLKASIYPKKCLNHNSVTSFATQLLFSIFQGYGQKAIQQVMHG